MTLIREAQATDLPAVAALFDAYRQFYEQPADPALALRFLQARQQSGESVILVAAATDSTALLGFCQLYPSFCSVGAYPIYVLYDLFVAPEARRGGLGRQLLQAAEDRARQDGKGRMDLTTAHSNTRAQALYTQMGWVHDEVFRGYTRTLHP